MFELENRRYIGSKAELADWILNIIQEQCVGSIFTDIFAGTAIIGKRASKIYEQVILNDFLYSNNIIYKAFFEDKEWDSKKVQNYISYWNNYDKTKIEKNYFSQNYGGKFFSDLDCKIIGAIRDDLEQNNEFNDKEKNILIASLIYSIDKIANTVGHYEAFFQNKTLEEKFIYKQINPATIKNIKIYQEDANLLAKKIYSDIVYIDPPYNSRQYSRFYHVLENLVKWDKPKLEGIALKPPEENMSEYCRSTALIAFGSLINDLQCKFIAVSYNNTYNSKSSSSKNKISLEQIEEILRKKGKTMRYERSHKYFNSGKTDFKDHREILFITKVG